jgi:hypothetical protein
MSKERELLKKVWEDLDGDRDNYNMLCEEIEELLAQPEQQEPVAWRWKTHKRNYYTYSEENYHELEGEPLYTAAPPKDEPPMTQREAYKRGYAQAELDLKRESLSDEEIRVIINQLPTDVDLDTGIEFCKIIEKAHGITGVDDE